MRKEREKGDDVIEASIAECGTAVQQDNPAILSGVIPAMQKCLRKLESSLQICTSRSCRWLVQFVSIAAGKFRSRSEFSEKKFWKPCFHNIQVTVRMVVPYIDY